MNTENELPARSKRKYIKSGRYARPRKNLAPNIAPDKRRPTRQEAASVVAAARREFEVAQAVVDSLAPLSPADRRKVVSAVCELYELPNPITGARMK